ncbi:MAG: sulfotransferase [Acetobacteraceae bacterium]|nr:sulfotransferase [Acetobacteraceae bacterium]
MTPIGYIDAFTRFHVDGWAADQDNWGGTVKITIFVNGEEVHTMEADHLRAQLDQVGPGATGRYAFSHYFESPLSPYRRNEIAIKVASTDCFLKGATLTTIEPIEAEDAGDQFRPQAPILLSTMGRSGSTLLMAVLAQHPQIVVAGQRPFEVEMGCYYAHALRALTAAGDHRRSLRADKITASEGRFHLGFNPYFEPSFGAYFRDPKTLPEFINKRVSGRLVTAFRGIILDYYQTVASDQDKSYPLYFAEKSLPEDDARLGVRLMFRNCKEIALVRDLRDALCSFMAFGNLSFQESLDDLRSSSARFLEIAANPDPGIHFIRYEDLVLQQRETHAALARFLGVSDFPYDEQRMGKLFGDHATTRSPADSIGRWRKDLTSEQLDQCGFFQPFLERFGYAV